MYVHIAGCGCAAIYRRHDASEDEEVNPDNFGFFLSSAEEEMALEQDLQVRCFVVQGVVRVGQSLSAEQGGCG